MPRNVSRDELGSRLIFGREGARSDAVLQVNDPQHGRHSDGRTKHRFELLRSHAALLVKARVGERRRGEHGFAGRQGLVDDRARETVCREVGVGHFALHEKGRSLGLIREVSKL